MRAAHGIGFGWKLSTTGEQQTKMIDINAASRRRSAFTEDIRQPCYDHRERRLVTFTAAQTEPKRPHAAPLSTGNVYVAVHVRVFAAVNEVVATEL